MPSTRSVTPVSAASPGGRSRGGGVESYRVCPMKNADQKNDAALTRNAILRPASAVTAPPADAPIASIADHVALDSALAGSRSSAEVMFGIVAVRAGSKNPDAATVSAMTTYAIQI